MFFLKDDEIELRPFVATDAAEIFEKVKANYEHLRQFLLWITPEYSIGSAKEFIEISTKEAEEKKRQSFGIFSYLQ